MVRVFVEGGGDYKQLRTKCRQAFKSLLDRAGFGGRMPQVVPCGTRGGAFKDFCTACRDDGDYFNVLLVDSEAAVATNQGNWVHLKKRDKWKRPSDATDDQAHLMIQCMETWLLSDAECLRDYFGQGFKTNSLPSSENLEEVSKEGIFDRLKTATSKSKSKGQYDKAQDSFELLGRIDPDKLKTSCPSAKRFFKVLDQKCRKA